MVQSILTNTHYASHLKCYTEYTECNFVPFSSSFAEICQSVLRNDPVTTEKCYALEIQFSVNFRKNEEAA